MERNMEKQVLEYRKPSLHTYRESRFWGSSGSRGSVCQFFGKRGFGCYFFR